MTLAGKRPEVIALYHRFIELAQACGPFTCAVSKTRITRHRLAERLPGTAPTSAIDRTRP